MIEAEDGTKYCPMSGHAKFDCPGYPSLLHKALMLEGFGVSYGSPTDEEMRELTRNDAELMRDEMHGRDL